MGCEKRDACPGTPDEVLPERADGLERLQPELGLGLEALLLHRELLLLPLYEVVLARDVVLVVSDLKREVSDRPKRDKDADEADDVTDEVAVALEVVEH
jgi:hypothetical protein